MSSTEQVDCDRCVNCGAIEDAIVRANRQPARSPVRSREPRGPRVQPADPADLMRCSTDPNHPQACHNLNCDRPYVHPAQAKNRRGDHIHSQHMGYGGGEPIE